MVQKYIERITPYKLLMQQAFYFASNTPVLINSFQSEYLCVKKDFVKYLMNQIGVRSQNRTKYLLCSEEVVYSYLEQVGGINKNEVYEFVGEFAKEEDLKRAAIKDFIFYGNHLCNHHIPLLMSDEELVDSFISMGQGINLRL